jgi:LPXTG-motif cell wall-anchored protein
MNTDKAYSLTVLPMIAALAQPFAPSLPTTGAAANPTLFVTILVIATLAIITGILLLRRKPPS